MAIPAGVYKIVLSGTLPGGEKFATAMWKSLTADPVTAQEAADATASSTTFGAIMTAARAINPASVVFTSVDVYYYANAGGVASDKGTRAISLAGTGGNPILPNQIALVTTFRTASPTRSGRGRMFWPGLNLVMEGGGVASAAPIQALLNALANYQVGTVGAGVVVSATQGQARPITRVDADRVPDCIQARRRSITAARLVGVAS